jgi:hypothetical protein
MSIPRDRDGDGFDDGRTDGPSGWQEPAHLGGGNVPADSAADTPADAAGRPPADEPAGPGAWQPPGWDLPTVEPERPVAAPSERSPQPSGYDPGSAAEEPIMIPPADPWGTQAWAMSVGWVLSDGTAAEDEPLTALARTAPVRPGREDRAGRVLRGRGNGLDLVAFDIVSPAGRRMISTHAVTAAPVLGAVPGFRLSPARMWRHGTGGLVQIPGPDPEFDRRWLLLAAEDGPQVRRLVEDAVVRQLLLGSDDGDELWSAAGFVAAVRPDGNRPQLIEHHARLLAAVVAALAAAA